MAKSADNKNNKKNDKRKSASLPARPVKSAGKAVARAPAKAARKPAKPARPAAKAPAAKSAKSAKPVAKKPAKPAPKPAAKSSAKSAPPAKPAARPTTKAAGAAAAKIPANPAMTVAAKNKSVTNVKAGAKTPPAKTGSTVKLVTQTKPKATLRIVPPTKQPEILKVEPRKSSVRPVQNGVKLQPAKAVNPLEPPANPNAFIHGQKPYIAKAGEAYMSEGQLQHFRRILLAWKQELMEEVDRTVHHMQDESANLPDPNDRATQEEEFALELRTRDRERKLIRKIDKTMQIIDDGDYGYCQACGIEVGIRRLEARPTAELCIDCKTLAEIKERQVGTGA